MNSTKITAIAVPSVASHTLVLLNLCGHLHKHIKVHTRHLHHPLGHVLGWKVAPQEIVHLQPVNMTLYIQDFLEMQLRSQNGILLSYPRTPTFKGKCLLQDTGRWWRVTEVLSWRWSDWTDASPSQEHHRLLLDTGSYTGEGGKPSPPESCWCLGFALLNCKTETEYNPALLSCWVYNTLA